MTVKTYERVSQSVFKKRINIRQMRDMMLLGKMIGKTVFFYGGAGLGKSQKMRQIADELFPHRIGNNLVDVRLSDKEPQDIAGIQIPIELPDGTARTVYAVPDFWPTDPDWEGIIFLDELPNAGPATQQSSYQVVLDHIAGSHVFPKGAIYAGAGNRDSDNGNTHEILGPLVNRMMMCEIDYDLDIWIEDFAIPFRIHPMVIGFLKNFPHHFYTGDVENRSTIVFASPRQWETVSKILFCLDDKLISTEIAEVAICGSVGEGLDTELLAYYKRAKTLPDLEDIFSGKTTKHKIPHEDMDLVYVLSQISIRKIEDEIMNNAMTDEEVIDRVGNFLTFMYENYGKENRDTVMAMITSLFRAPTGQTPVLQMNPRRSKMGPLLRKRTPTMMKVVMDYMTRYGSIMADFEK
ncbi:ribosomal protein uS19 [Salmonella phage SSBI34]|nr:ribosomal protein uS19 [Salmonella phage SSBI34]